MKQLSFWARCHPKAARLLIIGSFILLTILGYASGVWLSELGIQLPALMLLIMLSVYFTGIILYPEKHLRTTIGKSSFYFRQKACDLMLAVSTFMLLVYLTNKPETFIHSITYSSASKVPVSPVPGDSSSHSYKSIKDFSASMKDKDGNLLKWKERKKLLKEQVRSIKKADNMSNGAKAGLIILSVLVAIGLLFLVAALACDLSCSGSEGAALLVGIGGTGLIIFLLVLVIKSINKNRKRGEKATDKANI